MNRNEIKNLGWQDLVTYNSETDGFSYVFDVDGQLYTISLSVFDEYNKQYGVSDLADEILRVKSIEDTEEFQEWLEEYYDRDYDYEFMVNFKDSTLKERFEEFDRDTAELYEQYYDVIDKHIFEFYKDEIIEELECEVEKYD